MPDRPEYVKCIAYPIVNADTGKFDKSWCGRDIGREFAFTGLDHAAAEGIREGRLLACSECLEKAWHALNSMSEDPIAFGKEGQ
jgi:hypothetical protein